MRAWYLLKSSYFSSFFAFVAASRFCSCPDASSSSSGPSVNDFRTDFVWGPGGFGVTETRLETVGKSTPRGGVSSAGEGVLAIGMPSNTINALRKLGEGGEPESCRGTGGEVGSVVDLRRFCALKWSSGNGTCSRLRVDLDRLCITPLPEFWVKFEGRAFGFRLALEVEGAAVVIAGVRTGEARIGVNGVNINGEVKPRALRVTSSLLCVCAPLR